MNEGKESALSSVAVQLSLASCPISSGMSLALWR